MIWAIIIYLAGYPPLEYPVFDDRTQCVAALEEIKALSPSLVIACSPAGEEI